MVRVDPQLRVRLSDELHAKLKVAADISKRSLNAEIEARLELSFATPPGPEGAESIKVEWEQFRRLMEHGRAQLMKELLKAQTDGSMLSQKVENLEATIAVLKDRVADLENLN